MGLGVIMLYSTRGHGFSFPTSKPIETKEYLHLNLEFVHIQALTASLFFLTANAIVQNLIRNATNCDTILGRFIQWTVMNVC